MSSNNPVRKFLRTPKGTLTAVFGGLLLVSGTATGWSAVLPHLLAALVAACGVELLAGAIANKKLTWPTSALLSGAIVAFILAPETPIVQTIWVAGAASASKYLLTTRRGHLFNPAALALVVSVPLFATGQSWWGAGGDMPWPFIVLMLVGGVLIADRINKFPLVLSFAAVYFGSFTAIGLMQPATVAEMFRAPFVQSAVFLSLFMLTDPPTSPGRYPEQIAFGALAAITACVAQLAGVGQAYLLVGVLVSNAALGVWRISGSLRAPARTLAQREAAGVRAGVGLRDGM
jgi:Na+-translocating ferredoxin:NAD+ oxidoreductase RnfD subunit